MEKHMKKSKRNYIVIKGKKVKYEDCSEFSQTYHWQRSNMQTTAKRKNKNKS